MSDTSWYLGDNRHAKHAFDSPSESPHMYAPAVMAGGLAGLGAGAAGQMRENRALKDLITADELHTKDTGRLLGQQGVDPAKMRAMLGETDDALRSANQLSQARALSGRRLTKGGIGAIGLSALAGAGLAGKAVYNYATQDNAPTPFVDNPYNTYTGKYSSEGTTRLIDALDKANKDADRIKLLEGVSPDLINAVAATLSKGASASTFGSGIGALMGYGEGLRGEELVDAAEAGRSFGRRGQELSRMIKRDPRNEINAFISQSPYAKDPYGSAMSAMRELYG